MNDDFQLNYNEHGELKPAQARRRGLYRIPRKVRIVACIIAVAALIIFLLNIFKPQAQKRAIPETVVRVEVIEANRSTYPIVVNANGTIEACLLYTSDAADE